MKLCKKGLPFKFIIGVLTLSLLVSVLSVSVLANENEDQQEQQQNQFEDPPSGGDEGSGGEQDWGNEDPGQFPKDGSEGSGAVTGGNVPGETGTQESTPTTGDGSPENTEPATESTEPVTEPTDPATEPTTEPTETVPQETEEATEPTEPAYTIPAPMQVTVDGESWQPKAGLECTYNPVPLILQTDYSDYYYADGTIATSGCSMVSVAMVASYLRDEDISPIDLAADFSADEASLLQRMEAAAIVLDLSFTKTFYWSDVVQALQDGKVVIVLVDNRTPFTATQHFMVLTGITADGKILLNDPYGPNYTNRELRDGFKEGFYQSTLMSGFSGAWIFDEYEEPQDGVSRFSDMKVTPYERDLMARLVWVEARGESFEGQQAIAEIVLNRVQSYIFECTCIYGAIFAEGQFCPQSMLDNARPGPLQYKAVDCALQRENVLPADVFFYAGFQVNRNLWGRIGNHIFCGPY